MSQIEFIQAYFLLLLMGTGFCLGWYSITRGRIEILPDGRIHKTGKLLKDWYFFWNQYLVKETIPFTGDQLDKKYKDLLMHGGPYSNWNTSGQIKLMFGWVQARDYETLQQFQRDQYKISEALSVKVLIGENNNAIQFVKEYPKYYFPEWVRDWLCNCPTCSASFYGSLFYWGMVYSLKGLYTWIIVTQEIQLWDIPFGIKFLLWIPFAIILAFTNTYLAKKL
jgi:hypothetical protein